MKTFSRKHPLKAPVSPETEKPFFQNNPVSEVSFFSSSKSLTVHPKLKVSQPNDAYEQEADAMATSVVNHSSAAQTSIPVEGQVHRQAMEEEEPAQAKPDFMRMEKEEEPQAKPELMRVEQKEEEPQAKPELMRMEEEEPQAKLELMRMEEEEEPQAKPELMRMEQKEEEPMQAKAEAGEQSAKPSLSQRIEQTKGQGQSLPTKTQKEMAHAFNYDFSNVTIHTGLAAVQMTRDIQAQAFTHGNDIYFNEGKYNPDSSTGKELLAHELTHVVQQNPK